MSDTTAAAPPNAPASEGPDMKLFWGCLIALVATSFGFVIRTQIIDAWEIQFKLSETEKGEIFGVGLWPFAISIVVFSLIIDKIGYKTAMIFGLVCHVLSVIVTIFANGYWGLYIGTLIVALGNGTVEAYINPLVATMFAKDKTKWLNILHAGWPGGLVFGGILAIIVAAVASASPEGIKMFGDIYAWKIQLCLILIPVAAYAIMLWPKKFPVSERVAAGVSYKAMLAEVGAIGAFIIFGIIFMELGRVFEFPNWLKLLLTILVAGSFFAYTKSFGRPMFIFLLVIMVPLATTELGTDSWVTPLMKPQMSVIGLNAGWVLVYTSLIMTILRFCAGPIVHKLSPLGLLALSCAIAAAGLYSLSLAAGIGVLLAATLYGIGKTFFWPTMLGVVAERFPKGGALTLNGVSGVGMLGVGVIGTASLGYIQEEVTRADIAEQAPAIVETVQAEPEDWVLDWAFGPTPKVDQDAVATLPEEDAQIVLDAQEHAKRATLAYTAILPVIMLVCYLALIFYFKSKGGYRALALGEDDLEKDVGRPAATEL